MHRSSRSFAAALAFAMAALPLPGQADMPSSRVIVSSTLNHGIIVVDADTLEMTQPMLPSRGASPVRMDIETFEGTPYLFTANHGIAASVGIFDLSGDLVLEAPLSPILAGGFGAVGIDVSPTGTIAVTNNWFALGGCDMPNGSVSVLRATPVADTLTAVLEGVYDNQAAIPWGVAIDESRDALYVSTNCGDEVEVFDPAGDNYLGTGAHERTASVAVGRGPDATLFDAGRDRSYTVNIGGDSLSVIDGDTRTLVTTVPLPGAGPIDAALATSAAGADWILTSNGKDHSFSIIDRDAIEACIAAAQASCPAAEVARFGSGVPGGASEGVTYDPVSRQVFVVNKSPLGSPALSARVIDESGSELTAGDARVTPLPAIDPALPVPAIIAFDAVVQVRA